GVVALAAQLDDFTRGHAAPSWDAKKLHPCNYTRALRLGSRGARSASRLQLPHRIAEYVQARGHVRRRILGVGFVLDADVALELDLAQRLQYRRHVEHAAAEDHFGALLVVVVLQVDVVV